MTIGRLTRVLFAAFLVLLCISYAGGSKPPGKDQLRAKARYYFLKGAVSAANENYDQAYEYYKKAIGLDPEYAEAGFEFGSHRLVLLDDTFSSKEEMFRSLEYMKGMVDAYPRDVVAGESYAYFAMGADTLGEALRVYNNLVKEHPGLSRLYYPQSLLYLQLGQVDSAVNAIRQIERLEGATSETVVRKISYILTEGDTLAALREARNYAAENPGNPRVILDEAMIFNVMNYPDSAINILEKGLMEFPGNGDMQFDLGFLYLLKGDTANFHQYVSDALLSDYFEYDDKMEGLQMYISKLPKKGYDFRESDLVLKKLTEEYPKDVALMDITANYYYVKGDLVNAYQSVKKAYALEHDDPNLLGRMISFSTMAGKPEEGMKAYEEYPDENEKNTFALALSYISAAEAAKNYTKALEAVEKVLKTAMPELSVNGTSQDINPDSLSLKYSIQDLNIASATFEVAGDIYSRMGKQEDAVRSYENALTVPVANPSLMNNYAYYLVETVKVKPGTEEFEKAKKISYESIQQTQENPQAYNFDTYGWILFQERNYKDALQYMEIAVELEGDNPTPEILSHYGDVLFMNGQPDEALNQWERALELNPDDKVLKKKVEHKTFFYE